MFDYIIVIIIQIVCLVAINNTSLGHKHIVILIIITLVFNIMTYKSGRSMTRYKKKQTKIQPKQETDLKPVFLDNTLEMQDKTLFYSENLTTARFKNGKVYCLDPNNTFHIGNYRIEDDHVYVGANDDREIGRVLLNNGIPSLIILSNAGWYKHVGVKYGGQKPLTMVVGEIFYNQNKFDVQIIIDNQTNDVVALYKGDPIGAAAAFICLLYECSNSGRCFDFYHSH